MAETSWGYRAVVGFLAVAALGAVAFGGFGLYTILTGGTTDGTVSVDVLGEYGCESFDGDPEVAHNASYGVDRTLLSGSVVESFEPEQRLRYVFEIDGGILGASAVSADGTEVPVERIDEENRVVVELQEPVPFRLWIDSVSEEATVTRTQLDVCPPS